MALTPESTCRDRILSADPELTRTDRKIVGVLLSDYPFSCLRTLKEMAAASATSTATVLRLIAKLGYDGYPSFQRGIRNEIQGQFQSPLSRFGRAAQPAGSGQGSCLGRATDLWTEALRETAEVVSPVEFEQVAQKLSDPKRAVFLIGGRYSRSLADLFDYGLASLRPRVTACEGTARNFLRTLDVLKGRDVVVLFDFQRYQPEFARFAGEVRAAGATLIVMTDTSRSPSAQHADHVLAVPTESPSPFISSVTSLACLEALISRVAEVLGEAGKDRLAQVDARLSGGAA
ncbi:MurR/RpiR family transcriptional regulator [Mangrovicoccus ximenensis]|uniref:MurR/RpiR family transcriptional regulator n=1 Tax=Mangrovicoccus ximenensis TaxID=1911570 RepID=UPI000D383CB5|nr:MurR/RpiR family transcriptional regulator [Mangrovicoccus ximenensis]